MTSIRARLFLLLTAATSLVWLFAAGWIWLSTQQEVARVLDARLVEAGRMVASLVGPHRISPEAGARLPAPAAEGYAHQLSCQIWSFDGRLLGRSAGAPEISLATDGGGISETVIDGERWRVFALEDPEHGVRVVVGDHLKVRERLVHDLLLGLLLPAALVLPALAGLIWLGVGSGLRPLSRLAAALRGRAAEDLSPLPSPAGAAEIRPVIVALNGLFARVAQARERERHFTAFAAHELRTPLAALRTQAQVALAAREEPMRATALRQILVAVDRTARLVRQLLELARLDAGGQESAAGWVEAGPVLEALERELAPSCQARDVTLSVAPEFADAWLLVSEELLFTALRNLAENAVQHTPTGGQVRCLLRRDSAEVVLAVEDEGPGIPPDELDAVRHRFFRGRHRAGMGTGLGLSIAELALRRDGAALRLVNRREGGLRAEIVLAAGRLRSRRAADAPHALVRKP